LPPPLSGVRTSSKHLRAPHETRRRVIGDKYDGGMQPGSHHMANAARNVIASSTHNKTEYTRLELDKAGAQQIPRHTRKHAQHERSLTSSTVAPDSGKPTRKGSRRRPSGLGLQRQSPQQQGAYRRLGYCRHCVRVRGGHHAARRLAYPLRPNQGRPPY
jgi:hypothetical protein